MFSLFEGESVDDVWRQAASALTGDGAAHHISRAGATREILPAAISVKDPRQRWALSRRPALNPAYAIAELVWIVCGRNDSAFLNFFNTRLPDYAGTGDVYDGAYGYRLRRHFKIDQMTRAYEALKHNSESRQIVLQIWDPLFDLPLEHGQPSSPDVPCNLLSLLNVRGGALEWTQVVRSNDLFLGVPHDLFLFTSLQEIMAGWIGLRLGTYHQISNSLHVYERDIQRIAAFEGEISCQNTDSLAVPKADSEEAFRRLSQQVDSIIAGTISPDNIAPISRSDDLPFAFRNLRCVLLAEAARRLNRESEAAEVMQSCTNPVFRLLWQKWQERLSGNS